MLVESGPAGVAVVVSATSAAADGAWTTLCTGSLRSTIASAPHATLAAAEDVPTPSATFCSSRGPGAPDELPAAGMLKDVAASASQLAAGGPEAIESRRAASRSGKPEKEELFVDVDLAPLRDHPVKDALRLAARSGSLHLELGLVGPHPCTPSSTDRGRTSVRRRPRINVLCMMASMCSVAAPSEAAETVEPPPGLLASLPTAQRPIDVERGLCATCCVSTSIRHRCNNSHPCRRSSRNSSSLNSQTSLENEAEEAALPLGRRYSK